ncbi:probable beta-D-xylosidase 7 [Coffea eugenioides]|uniref:probable beta-D-xylosidase 7 n=1 Tax=Coffea eugenioides TaxID=49369 RepID=UPI000F606393|nr:probable beta-D-xylosidase 7 [Coffea eugenioides]
MRILEIKIIFISSVILVTAIESFQPPYSCDSTNPLAQSFPFCNTTLAVDQRVQDLVSRLTLDEKISQLVDSAPAIPRLNISAFEWWSEALHGISESGKGILFNGTLTAATVFPQVILTAASFDAYLWYNISQAIGKEGRAFYNEGQALGVTFWAPNINIFRDPRWGRGQETPGEDPSVAESYAVSYVRGIQGDSFDGGQLKDGHLQVSACCKHFTAYDLDNWDGVTRFVFNANVTEQDLADTYEPPFKSCIRQGQATGLMCAYNLLNGVPNCADYNLLTETVRGEWGFKGYIASDCDAVAVIHDDQGYAKLPEDAVADVLKAGMDVDCGSFLMNYTGRAIQQKKLSESDLDRALHNLFSIRMRLGLFNGDPTRLEYGNIGPEQVCSQEHQDLALEAARDGIVLLKNSYNLLPLPKAETVSLAVIGPNANTSETFVGNYHGLPCKNITIFQALGSYTKNAVYSQGCDGVNCTSPATVEAFGVAQEADYVVLVMGLDQSQEREELDRTELVLPGQQEILIKNITLHAKNPVILVLLSGGPVDISFARDDPRIGSILWAGYPGEAGGIALAQIIFGDHNPGGRLPVTWYPEDFIKVPMTDMRMRSEPSTGYPGRTYRFYTGPKVYEFGYGLSYSNYTHEFVHVTPDKIYINKLLRPAKAIKRSATDRYALVSELGKELCESKKFSTKIAVENHGNLPGKHPVLLFVKQANLTIGSPQKQLIAFRSVRLEAGERAHIDFVLNPCQHLSRANKDGLLVIEEGYYHLILEDKEYPINVVL